jgi:ribosomal protein S18 acetylase RimI-like enzyme
MNGTAIGTLENTSLEDIHQAFSEAFSDYSEPFQITLQQFQYMLERRGFDPHLSFGAFSEGRLVSFVLNGFGTWHNHFTAYDTGTGTIPSFRHQGLVTSIITQAVPALQEKGIHQYLLEVIKINAPARRLYEKQQFEVTREFDYFVTPRSDIVIPQAKDLNKFQVVQMEGPDWNTFQSFWDFEPSWQNSIDSISRKLVHFDLLGVYEEDNSALLAYAFLERETGDIPQFAVSKEHRRRGVGTFLLSYIRDCAGTPNVKFINVETTCLGFKEFMQSCNIQPGHGQFEMVRKI